MFFEQKKRFTGFFLTIIVLLLFSFSTAFGEESKTIKIVPLGDSITLTYKTSWRYELWKLLKADGYNFTYVGSVTDWFNPGDGFPQNHEGHGGWNINEIIGSLDKLMTYDFDMVLVHLGTNDMWQNDSADTGLKDLAQLVDKLREKNPKVIIVLAQIIPAKLEGYPNFEEFSLRIPEVAIQKSTEESPIYTADLFSNFDPTTGLTKDGVHPTSEGFVMMGRDFYTTVKPILEEMQENNPPAPEEPKDFEVTWKGSVWGTGFSGNITLTNNTDKAITGWTVEFDFENGEKMTHYWQVEAEQKDTHLTFTNNQWNGTVKAGESVTFGFQGTHNSHFSFPQEKVVITTK